MLVLAEQELSDTENVYTNKHAFELIAQAQWDGHLMGTS